MFVLAIQGLPVQSWLMRLTTFAKVIAASWVVLALLLTLLVFTPSDDQYGRDINADMSGMLLS